MTVVLRPDRISAAAASFVEAMRSRGIAPAPLHVALRDADLSSDVLTTELRPDSSVLRVLREEDPRSLVLPLPISGWVFDHVGDPDSGHTVPVVATDSYRLYRARVNPTAAEAATLRGRRAATLRRRIGLPEPDRRCLIVSPQGAAALLEDVDRVHASEDGPEVERWRIGRHLSGMSAWSDHERVHLRFTPDQVRRRRRTAGRPGPAHSDDPHAPHRRALELLFSPEFRDADARGEVNGVQLPMPADSRLRDRILAQKWEQAPNSLRSFGSDWRSFTRWCADRGEEPLTADTDLITAYALHRTLSPDGGRISPTTVRRHITGIGYAYRILDRTPPIDSPEVARLMRRIAAELRREREEGRSSDSALPAPATGGGRRKRRHAPALPSSVLAQMALSWEIGEPIGLRNRTMLLLGFMAALRRSELAILDVEHLTFTSGGLTLLVPHSKADQLGQGEEVHVKPTRNHDTDCVAMTRRWLRYLGRDSGPLFVRFRKGGGVTSIPLHPSYLDTLVHVSCERIGLDWHAYSAHSLRAGLATEAVRGGGHERDIMRHTRHSSTTAFRLYVEQGSAFGAQNPTGLIGDL